MASLCRILLALASPALLVFSALSQTPDPANLAGEHVAPPALADTLPLNHGAAALQQLLLKLRTRASLMLIVAHPDDEDGGMLTFESRGHGARVATLTLTRGEGGQNLMSADFDDALGLIRTQELLAADRFFGAGQFFGTEADFGFSKTKEETLSKWTHDRVLYDAVRAVRLYRPLVLASVFVGGVTDGHGHHQVAGEITQEVFLAAADPKVFPGTGLPAWAPLKVYARVPFSRVTREGMYDYATGKTTPPRFHNYVTGEDSTLPPEPTVEIHEGERSSAPGMDGESYVQFARRGLALQKTQIGPNARLAPAGAFDVGYTLMGSRVCAAALRGGARASSGDGGSGRCPGSSAEQSFFDDIDTSLPGLADMAPGSPVELRPALEGIDHDLAEAQRLFDPARPEHTFAPLQAALRKLDSLIAAIGEAQFAGASTKFNLLHELRIKRVELNDALILALGVTVDATLTAAAEPKGAGALVPGHPLQVRATVHSNAEIRIASATLQISGRDHPFSIPAQPVASPNLVSKSTPAVLTFQDRLPADTPVTRPFFSRPALEQPFYTLSSDALRNAPVTPAPLVAEVHVVAEGSDLEVQANVHTASAEASGTLQPAVVVPALSVSVAPATGLVALTPGPFTVNASTRSQVPHTEARLKLTLPAGWKAQAAQPDITLKHIGDHALVPFTVDPARVQRNARYLLTAVASTDRPGGGGAQQFSESFRSVGYPGLTYTNLYTPATYQAAAVDVTTAPGLRIGYVAGTGDDVPAFLPGLGVTVSNLEAKDLTAANLAKFDAILLGVRAYAAHPELAGQGSAPLLEYARNGGVVIVQYMTARYGDAEAPFPISVPGDPAHNVVVEEQPVTLLDPAAPLLSWPNKITAADFDQWVAERGHGFAASWAPQFTPLLEVHDPDQDPQKGGLLLAPVGKGAYVYCALALYRQLPEGVPGAYRLLANLVSYGKNPKR